MKQFLNYLLNKHWILHVVICFLNEKKKEKIYIERFKAEMLFWGHDISDYTDKEIKKSINAMGELVNACGLTAEQISNSMRTLANFEIK